MGTTETDAAVLEERKVSMTKTPSRQQSGVGLHFFLRTFISELFFTIYFVYCTFGELLPISQEWV